MKVVVAGLWHLGSVTAACCAEHFAVTGLDFDGMTVSGLAQGTPPISEPGLADLVRRGLDAGRLKFTADAAKACRDAEVLWVCYDTPVDENDVADTDFVRAEIARCLPHLPPSAVVLISSQMPVGTCAQLERAHPGRHFACSPENLRLGKALEVFQHPERVVIGARGVADRERLAALFAPFCGNLLWMSPESAEMTKHAINSFFAASITFTNELARLCELTGAEAKEVERGLKSEPRIGPRAYVSPGGPFAGGTLARDVRFLVELAEAKEETLSVLPAILESNVRHRGWALRALEQALGASESVSIAILGLTYKAGTDTLRRSSAVELALAAVSCGWSVRAFDPAVKTLPAMLDKITLCAGAAEALAGADAAVVCTEWPEFRLLDWGAALPTMRRALVIDANRFVFDQVKDAAHLEYRAVGLPESLRS